MEGKSSSPVFKRIYDRLANNYNNLLLCIIIVYKVTNTGSILIDVLALMVIYLIIRNLKISHYVDIFRGQMSYRFLDISFSLAWSRAFSSECPLINTRNANNEKTIRRKKEGEGLVSNVTCKLQG